MEKEADDILEYHQWYVSEDELVLCFIIFLVSSSTLYCYLPNIFSCYHYIFFCLGL